MDELDRARAIVRLKAELAKAEAIIEANAAQDEKQKLKFEARERYRKKEREIEEAARRYASNHEDAWGKLYDEREKARAELEATRLKKLEEFDERKERSYRAIALLTLGGGTAFALGFALSGEPLLDAATVFLIAAAIACPFWSLSRFGLGSKDGMIMGYAGMFILLGVAAALNGMI